MFFKGCLLFCLFLAFKRDLLQTILLSSLRKFQKWMWSYKGILGQGIKKDANFCGLVCAAQGKPSWTWDPRAKMKGLRICRNTRWGRVQTFVGRGLALSGEVWDWGDLLWLSKSECPQLTTRVVDLRGQPVLQLRTACWVLNQGKTLFSYCRGVAIEDKLSPQWILSRTKYPFSSVQALSESQHTRTKYGPTLYSLLYLYQLI